MKEYEEFLLSSYLEVSKENPGIVNTAKEYNEGFNVLVSAIKRKTNADDSVIRKWLKDYLDLQNQ